MKQFRIRHTRRFQIRHTIGTPLKFNDRLKRRLYFRLKRLDHVKYLRWYKDESYLGFRIHDNSYKIIVSPSYRPYEKFRHYNSEEWIFYKPVPVWNDGAFVINATQFYDTLDEIIVTCIEINNWMVDYYNVAELNKMAEYADSQNMDPTVLDYDYIKKERGFSICHGEKLEELIDELAHNYIAHLNLKDNRFGALFEVVKMMASVIFDYTIDEKERK